MDWKLGPPVLVGEKVFWSGNIQNEPQSGTVKWIGKIPELSTGWSAGIEFDTPLRNGGSDGFWKDRKLFECQSKHGLIVNIQEIQKLQSKFTSKRTTIQSRLDLKLDDSQVRNSTHLDLENKSVEKNQLQIIAGNQHSDVESKLNEGFQKNQKSIRRTASGLNSTIRKKFNKTSKFEEALGSLKTKNQGNEKSSRGVKRKKNSFRESKISLSRKLDSDCPHVQDAKDDFINFTVNKAFEDPQKLNIKNMNEVVGYFKEIKEDGRVGGESDKQLDGFMGDANLPGQSKEKKFFSFLKWFKKNKDDPVLKNFTESSAASSPMSVRRSSSCESIDTLFSTQTVRSFAYIPPTQYLPSAPPSTLLDFDKPLEDNVFKDPSEKEVESIYDRKKKRKAPDPPRFSRENSLPSTLEHKKSDEELMDGAKTYHRRTVSESFKDKKAGAYCHVQGKRKAPLPPPTPSIYPNLQKLNSQYSSLNKKKKPAPPPPDFKNGDTYVSDVGKEKLNAKTETFKNEKLGEQINEEKESSEVNSEKEDKKKVNSNQIPKENPMKDVSLSPLPSRPWYKRSHRDSSGSSIIRKDLLKGFERKKNKESEDWMPEVGFPRRSLSTDSSHNKFNIFSRLDKNEDKKKEEKRKSQISILTNISELDREAAEIVKKEQAEEKKMIAANDAKFYSSDSSSPLSNNKDRNKKIQNDDPVKGVSDSQNPVTKLTSYKSGNEKLELPKAVSRTKAKESVQELQIEHFRSPSDHRSDKERTNDVNKNEQSPSRDGKSDIKESTSQEDVTSSSKATTPVKVHSNGIHSGANYFKVENKELNYLNKAWICQKCTLENPGWRVFCEICSSVKPRFLINFEKKPQRPLEKSTESNSKTENKETKSETQPLPNAKTKNNEPNLSPEKNLSVSITEDKNDTNEDHTKENLEEIRQKQMGFFTSKLDEQQESKPNYESTTSIADPDKKNLKYVLKEMKESFPKKESEKSLKERSQEPEKKPKSDGAPSMGDNLKGEKVQPLKPTPLPRNSLTNISLSTKAIQEDVEKSSAVKKKQQFTQKKNEEIAEAYVVTKTIVLEDIIIKKGENVPKVSVPSQTKAIRTTSDQAVRPPPRTKKTFVDASVETKSSDLGYKPGPSIRKYEKPLNLTIVEDKPQTEDKTFEELEELTIRLTNAEGVADFRANIETMAPNTEMNTVAVNRLLRRLEAAINSGEHVVAAGLAKELALMKINCSVTACERRQVGNVTSPASSVPGSSKITIDLYVEDKVSHQGPIQIQVSPTMTLLQLKKKVHQELGIPMDVQRWILGKQLATDESKTLDSAGIVNDSCSVFLYLVAPGNRGLETNSILMNTDKHLEIKSSQNSPETEPKTITGVRGKGWYYNYEENHYSFCEDTEDESRDSNSSSSQEKNENNSLTDPTAASNSKVFLNKKTNPISSEVSKEKTKKLEKPSLFSLQSRESESDVEREVKLIPVNSVKQKVEKLNKSFAESNAPLKLNLKASQSVLEYWKCLVCSSLNVPERLICSACSTKKGAASPKRETPKSVCGSYGLDRNQPEPTTKKSETTVEENIHYKALIELQDADLVPNTEPFNCPICLVDYTPGEGVILKDCLHTFCRACLVNTVEFSEDAEVKCPYFDETYSCTSVLQQREIKALVPKKLFELHLAKSVKEAENKIGNAFHCKTPDCKGWCIYEDNVNEFHCPVCKNINCLTCQTIHTGVNCKQYQERMKDASETDVDAKKTRIMLEEMVEKGEAMACPKCQVVLMKKWGCDWLRCSMCKTEICWVTRGFRWGPEGKGDTSGGCKCGVNGVKCHPKCNYCH